MTELIFEQSTAGRINNAQYQSGTFPIDDLPQALLRKTSPALPEVSEMQAVRHYTRLSQLNFAIDTNFYPLGSCTMKHNPRICNEAAMYDGFSGRHPLSPASTGQGVLSCLYDLQEILKDISGMSEVSLAPMAGAQGEFTGIAMIRAYHEARADDARQEILVPDAAHGTNPATAVMCGYTVKEIPTLDNGDVDIDALRAAVGPQTAGLMLTNPSTLGVFERQITEIAALVHEAGGLLYYDGANMNAILGKVKPGEMGFDVIHLNLHKTFSTPHGGGGPGAGPVGVSKRLVPFLPVPRIAESSGEYVLLDKNDCPQSIGRLSCFMGNAGILLRAWIYARMLGRDGMKRVADYATLNANYMKVKLEQCGFEMAYKSRRATHEFILTLKKEKAETGVTAMDFAKRLLDKGYHAPTTYFPLLVPECFLIEPTESESLEELDGFIAAMEEIRRESVEQTDLVKSAPHSLPVRRLDDVRAARQLDVVWQEDAI
ncbi:MAG: aminomethyl-transferring glycine dehydrogenase subunit GcvPB [Arenicellales bacterium]